MYGHAAVHRDRVKNSVSVIVARKKKGRHEWHVEEDEDERQQQRVTGKSNNCINLFLYGSAVIRCLHVRIWGGHLLGIYFKRIPLNLLRAQHNPFGGCFHFHSNNRTGRSHRRHHPLLLLSDQTDKDLSAAAGSNLTIPCNSTRTHIPFHHHSHWD